MLMPSSSLPPATPVVMDYAAVVTAQSAPQNQSNQNSQFLLARLVIDQHFLNCDCFVSDLIL